MGWVKASNRIRNLFRDETEPFQDNQIYRAEALLRDKDDERRKVYAVASIPAWFVKQVGEENIRRYVPEGLIQFNGIKVDHMIMEVRPWICDAEIGKMLDISEGNGIFRRLYTHYSTDDRILTIADTFVSSSTSIRKIKLEW